MASGSAYFLLKSTIYGQLVFWLCNPVLGNSYLVIRHSAIDIRVYNSSHRERMLRTPATTGEPVVLRIYMHVSQLWPSHGNLPRHGWAAYCVCMHVPVYNAYIPDTHPTKIVIISWGFSGKQVSAQHQASSAIFGSRRM